MARTAIVCPNLPPAWKPRHPFPSGRLFGLSMECTIGEAHLPASLDRLRAQILAAYDKAPNKYRQAEGEGWAPTLETSGSLVLLQPPSNTFVLRSHRILLLLLPIASFQESLLETQQVEHFMIHTDLRNSHYPLATISLSDFVGGELWIESPTGDVCKEY